MAKAAVVLGGAGGVGEGIVRALLVNGWQVIVPSRSSHKLDSLTAYLRELDISTGGLIPYLGALASDESATDFRSLVLKSVGSLQLAVASLGGWWQGKPLADIEPQLWEKLIADNLTSHYWAVRTLVPLLAGRGTHYVHINGFSAEQAYPKAAPVAAFAAAQKSLMLSLAKELAVSEVRVHELILGPVNTRDRIAHNWAKPGEWIDPVQIGQGILQLLSAPDYNPDTILHRWLLPSDIAQVQ